MTPLSAFQAALVLFGAAVVQQASPPEQSAASLQSGGRRWYLVRESGRACGGSERIRNTTPLAEVMSLKVSTEQLSYYVGEPIRLALTLRNESDRTIRGNFTLSARCAFVQIYHRRAPNEFQELLRPDPFRIPQPDGTILETIPFTGVDAKSLRSGEEVVGDVTFAFEPVSGRFVFDAPGRYEFKAVYADMRGSSKAVLSSEVLTVRVDAPPPNQEQALDSYARGELAPVAQYDPLDSPEPPTWITTNASEFLERYPESVYASVLKKGLFLVLRARVQDNRATPRERSVFEKLRAEGVGQETQEPIDLGDQPHP